MPSFRNDPRPVRWSRNHTLGVGFALVFVGALCGGLYLLMIELKLSRGEAVFYAVSLFVFARAMFLWAVAAAIRNPSKDRQLEPRVSRELYDSLTRGAKLAVGSPLSVPLALIAVVFKMMKERG